jgi:hypothetical protein
MHSIRSNFASARVESAAGEFYNKAGCNGRVFVKGTCDGQA